MAEVFISYRHVARDMESVRDLALRLERAGHRVMLDELEQERTFHQGGPDEGWPQWSRDQASKLDQRVLVIASQGWFACYDGKQAAGTGLGAAAEARCIAQRFYDSGSKARDIRVVALDPDDLAHQPLELRGVQAFQVPEDLAKLLAWLSRGVNEAVSPAEARAQGDRKLLRRALPLAAALLLAGIFFDMTAYVLGYFEDASSDSGLPIFGVGTTTYWSLGVITTIPLAICAGILGCTTIANGWSRFRRRAPLAIWAVPTFPLVFIAIRFGLIELPRHLRAPRTAETMDYCQWSDLHTGCGSQLSSSRIALFVTAYVLVICAYYVVLAMATYLVVAQRLLRQSKEQSSGYRRLLTLQMEQVAFFYQLGFGAYLYHLGLVRSAKIYMKSQVAELATSEAPLGLLDIVASKMYWEAMVPVFYSNAPQMAALFYVLLIGMRRIRAAPLPASAPASAWDHLLDLVQEATRLPMLTKRIILGGVFMVVFPLPTYESLGLFGAIMLALVWYSARSCEATVRG